MLGSNTCIPVIHLRKQATKNPRRGFFVAFAELSMHLRVLAILCNINFRVFQQFSLNVTQNTVNTEVLSYVLGQRENWERNSPLSLRSVAHFILQVFPAP
jgi:hypothetical protein